MLCRLEITQIFGTFRKEVTDSPAACHIYLGEPMYGSLILGYRGINIYQ